MHIGIIAVGRMKPGPERELVTRYLDRASATGKQHALTGFTVSELPESRAGIAKARKADEAKAISSAIPDGAISIALDEHAKSQSSVGFSSLLANWRDDGRPAIRFIIGGADGLDHSLIAQADLNLAFSTFTWPHQLVRIMLAEQLYRATTILSGHPYHRGD